jgi:hypothetical protein
METQSAQKNGVTFKVAEVVPSTKRLSAITVREAISRATKNDLLTCPQADLPVIEAADFHPLIAAAATAFKQHYPLVLSPDMLWLTILQGVSQHVANHPDSLRSKLVHHETKIELIVDSPTGGLPTNDEEMLAAVNLFTKTIEKHIQPDKKFLFQTEFSTTTAIERIAMSVVLMDTFQPYFDYVFACICGIPAITLEGTPEDWELLESKVQALHESDLDLSWWTEHLLPLCRHFVRAARNDVDAAHWNDLFKLTQRYGVEDLNGWLLRFIPYVKHDKNEPARHKNPIFDFRPEPEEPGASMHTITGCTSSMLPSGISAAPVICWNKATNEKIPFQFIAGFGGVTQQDDLSLRPLIIWSISEAPVIDRLLNKIRTQHESSPSKHTDVDSVLQVFKDYLPGDFWRFYTTTDGATLNFRYEHTFSGKTLTIRPLDRVSPIFEYEIFDSLRDELNLLVRQGILTKQQAEDRIDFYNLYRHLLVFASSDTKHGDITYLFGSDPEASIVRQWDKGEEIASRGQIFRWNGELVPGAFVPVAHNLTEWLTKVFEADAMKVELVNKGRQPNLTRSKK